MGKKPDLYGLYSFCESMNKLLYTFKSGKNNKALYFFKNYCRLGVPSCFYSGRLSRKIAQIEKRSDKEYIEDRVAYYNKLSAEKTLPAEATSIAEFAIKKQKVYYFDLYESLRWFKKTLRYFMLPGDIVHIPEYPTFVKSRPVHGDNANSVLLKLNKIRHFIFVDDKIPYEDKKDLMVFRGKVKDKPIRQKFMQMYFGHPMCDLGDVSSNTTDPEAWRTPKMTIAQQLEYKFILAIEGNDVASNLKWIMSSGSVAVMPQPTYETWFMEGRLIPNYHYIEIAPDFSDLEERLCYYIAHPEEAKAIVRHANEYVEQFRDEAREELISLRVAQKYFEKTGQL